MGTKHSTSMSSRRSTPRQNSSASPRLDAPSAAAAAGSGPPATMMAAAEQQLSPGGAYSKLLTVNTATIRPVEIMPRDPTSLDLKITNALKEIWRKRAMEDQRDIPNPFTRILLKLPLAAKAFNSVRSTFEAFDKEGKGFIVYADIAGAFEQLGVNFSQEEISQVFEESDMRENGQLTFKEFLVCLAIAFVLHKIPSLESERLSIFYAPIARTSSIDSTSPTNSSQSILFGEGNKLRIAFQLAVDAFLWFDVDGNGLINRTEMSSRLETSTALHSPTKKMSTLQERAGFYNKAAESGEDSSNAAIWERRFAEMDWDNDGTIHFKEFLMAFESWVGLEDEDEEDDDDERKDGASQ